MRLSCLAILMLAFGLVGFDAVGTGPAAGQVPATTPVPASPAALPLPPTTAPAATYAPMTVYTPVLASEPQTAPANAFFSSGVVDRPSSKEQELERQSHTLAR